MENYPVMVNPEGPLYSKAVGIRFKVGTYEFQYIYEYTVLNLLYFSDK